MIPLGERAYEHILQILLLEPDGSAPFISVGPHVKQNHSGPLRHHLN